MDRIVRRAGEAVPRPALSLAIDPDSLRDLISQVVEQTVRKLQEARATLPEGRVALSEAEAAAALGVEAHVLRDARKRREIRAYVISGRRIRYRFEDIEAYLQRRVWSEEGARRWPHGRPSEKAENLDQHGRYVGTND
jgi:excisionase family DNA binding protein